MSNSSSTAPAIACPAALSQTNLSALERQIDTLLLTSPKAVFFDLNAIDAVESAGLEWLISVQNRLNSANVQMFLRNPSPKMRDILIATRLDSRFQHEAVQEVANA